MASIHKRGTKWQVQIRRKGFAALTRTFRSKQNAQKWARQTEAELERHGLPSDRSILKSTTLKDLLTRYRDTIVPIKRGRDVETIILNAFMRHPIARLTLMQIKPAHFADYRDERLTAVRPATVIRELGIIHHAVEIARKDWSIPLGSNPLRHITKPNSPPSRTRRLMEGEEARLLAALATCRKSIIPLLARFALATAMRRGELLNARWLHVNLEKRLLHIPLTKNGEARTIPLSSAAISVLQELPRDSERIFPIELEAFRSAWRRIGIADLHFHDLRHEAISRFFEQGLSIPEVALISGHKDFRMLARYTHLRPESLVNKLG